MQRAKDAYTIRAVTNAFRLLEAFSTQEEVGVTELAQILELPKNNVFRLLATLEQQAYVEQIRHRDRYRLGPRCLELGWSFARSRNLVRLARPVLEWLVGETGETAHLGVLHDCEVIHLDGLGPRRLVLTPARVGQRLPCHCTALGKVLVGCAPPGVWETYDRCVTAGGLERRTAATILDRDKLFEQLRGVAAQGWAVDLEECEEGLCCAAAPVHDGRGELVAALSISGPAFRVGRSEVDGRLVGAVLTAAERLSRELGHLP